MDQTQNANAIMSNLVNFIQTSSATALEKDEKEKKEKAEIAEKKKER